MVAAHRGHAKLVEVLRETSALGKRTKSGKTALILAIRNGKYSCAALLVKECSVFDD